MVINKLKINGFGKLENKEIILNNNINLIYGKNEAGKTTLLKFISGIFYGVSKNKNKKEFPDFERYKPWGEKEFSGKIEYVLDNNEEYEVFREFSKKNPKIYKGSEDISKMYNIDKNKGSEFFYEQTGIDEIAFESTTLIEQKEVVLDDSEQTVLTQKIANILSSGAENISYKKTIDKLNKKSIEEVGSIRSIGRPLNVVDEKIKELQLKKQNIEISNNQKENIENNKKIINNKIIEKDLKINLIKEINKIKYEEKIENEKIKINKDLIKEEEIKINNLQNKRKENNNKKENKNIINLASILILFIFNIILFVFKINKTINLILFLLMIIDVIYSAITKTKNNKKIKEKNRREKEYLNEIKNVENNIKNIQEKINKLNEENTNKFNIYKNEIINKYKNKIDEKEINYLIEENINELNNIFENLNSEVSNLKLQLYTNEVNYNNILKNIEQKAKIEEQLNSCMEEKEDILKLEKSINIAKTALENAYNKMKNEITPKFTKNLSGIIAKISSGKYNKIKFIDGQGLIVELENGQYVNANKLSIGTIDELYLSLRLSAMQEIAKEKMPIILDETFAYFDNERLQNILKYINEELKNNQVIIFTCSNREKDMFDKSDIKYNYVEI